MLYIKYSEDKKTLNMVVKKDIKCQSIERQASAAFPQMPGRLICSYSDLRSSKGGDLCKIFPAAAS